MTQEIRKVTVVGTGILGTQIAVQAAFFGYEVSAYDADPTSFARNHEHLKSVLQKARGTPFFTAAQWDDGAREDKTIHGPGAGRGRCRPRHRGHFGKRCLEAGYF